MVKIRKEQLKEGDIFVDEYRGFEIYCKVVEICSDPVYNVVTFEPTYPIIIDIYVPFKNVHLGYRKIQDEEQEFSVIYRENPEKYESVFEALKYYEENKDKTEETEQ